MAETVDAATIAAWITETARRVHADVDRLTELDTAIGDGDHGRNLTRGLDAACHKLEAEDGDSTPRRVLTVAGTALVSSVGGASGPLYGTFWRRTAKALPDGPTVDAAELGAALAEGDTAVRELGGATDGDKTMLDALTPAVAALRRTLDEGGGLADAARAAADAATAGARATVPLVARKGRASYLGERSAGHEDPGAASTALIWAAFAHVVGAGSGS